MNNKKGFGLISILITLAIIVGITGTTFYALQNVGEIDTLDNDSGKESIDSVIQLAEDVKQQVKDRNAEINEAINVPGPLDDITFEEGQAVENAISDNIIFGEEARSLCGPEPPAQCQEGMRLGCNLEHKTWNCFRL
ncbi:hypothetical protein IIB51_00105 [Patescibacteria group bacterium]|nr:hypothetical protein [Patescibacteria group bacterium]MCH8889085.1 hypothetical protein [Patescibacteria group bacterium]